MPKRTIESDDSEYSEEHNATFLPKKSKPPTTPRMSRTSNDAGIEGVKGALPDPAWVTPKKRRREGFEEQGSSPSKAVLEAETILAQYSPGTKRNVKVSDLQRLKVTHDERRQEALMKVENQKQLIEERRKEIFSRLTGLGYSETLIDRDRYDQLKARTRWWQLVEEPQELTDQEWEKIRHDLCVILDRRKETVRSLKAQAGVSPSSSPLRPKASPIHSGGVCRAGQRRGAEDRADGNGTRTSGALGLQKEVDDRLDSSGGSSGPLPKLDFKNTPKRKGAGGTPVGKPSGDDRLLPI